MAQFHEDSIEMIGSVADSISATCSRVYSSAIVCTLLTLVWIVSSGISAAAADCASLTSLTLKDTTIKSATIVPASGHVPEYCRILGSITDLPESTILFEVALPTTKWNGKYFVAGGGGFNGVIPRLDQALAEGYAAAGSDTGHVSKNANDGEWALDNMDAQYNYAFLATHVVTLLGKQVLRSFYGQNERRSYFMGCSNGGKMALMEVQRYPDDFDAVISGDPVIKRTKIVTQFAWNAQALAAAPIPPSKIPVIEKATLAACRESGGAINGLIMTPGRCKFDPKTIACLSGDGPSCLTAGQAEALAKILHGPVNSAGALLFPGFLPGHEDDYEFYVTGSGRANSSPSSQWGMQDNFLRYFVFGPSFDSVKQFNFDSSPAALVPLAAIQDVGSANLSAFRAHGGKLLMYHGWADHSVTPIESIEYYEDVIGTMSKEHGQRTDDERSQSVSDFFRLFMVPGMHHCSKGPGPNSFGGAGQGFPPRLDAQHDILMALDRWVEYGVAPEKIIASHLTNGVVDRSLPLCPYPQIPVYNGAGDVNTDESYHCEIRSLSWALDRSQNSRRPPRFSDSDRRKRVPPS